MADQFLLHHKRYGYIGYHEGETTYTTDDMKDAALFTHESAMILLVDVDNPKLRQEPMTKEDIDALPFTLVDTHKQLQQQKQQQVDESLMLRESARNAFSNMSDQIDQLRTTDNVVLAMDDLAIPERAR